MVKKSKVVKIEDKLPAGLHEPIKKGRASNYVNITKLSKIKVVDPEEFSTRTFLTNY